MKLVRDILYEKGDQVYTITPDIKIFDALKLMAEKEIGALVILESGSVVGIVSERDYARKVVLKGKSSKETSVKEIMTSEVLFVSPYMDIEECMALMVNKRVRHLPVMKNKNLVGIISIGDVIKAVIDEKRMVIDELERYINYRR